MPKRGKPRTFFGEVPVNNNNRKIEFEDDQSGEELPAVDFTIPPSPAKYVPSEGEVIWYKHRGDPFWPALSLKASARSLKIAFLGYKGEPLTLKKTPSVLSKIRTFYCCEHREYKETGENCPIRDAFKEAYDQAEAMEALFSSENVQEKWAWLEDRMEHDGYKRSGKKRLPELPEDFNSPPLSPPLSPETADVSFNRPEVTEDDASESDVSDDVQASSAPPVDQRLVDGINRLLAKHEAKLLQLAKRLLKKRIKLAGRTIRRHTTIGHECLPRRMGDLTTIQFESVDGLILHWFYVRHNPRRVKVHERVNQCQCVADCVIAPKIMIDYLMEANAWSRQKANRFYHASPIYSDPSYRNSLLTKTYHETSCVEPETSEV